MFFMSGGASLRGKRDSFHEAEELLRTNPVHVLRRYKVSRLDLGCTTVDEEFDAINEA